MNIHRYSAIPGDKASRNGLLDHTETEIPLNPTTSSGQISRSKTMQLYRTHKHRLQGWRFGVAVGIVASLCVLILNLAPTIWAVVSLEANLQDEGTVAYQGNCETATQWTTGLHVVINILSSALLCASNYAMQTLSAPTREEINQAHARGGWMDVGLLSLRNLFANQYPAAVVNPDFYTSPSPLRSADTYSYFPYYQAGDGMDRLTELQNVQTLFADNYNNPSTIQNMTISECRTAYWSSFLTGHGHVLAVTSTPGNSSIPFDTVFWADAMDYQWFRPGEESYHWLCLEPDQSFVSYQNPCNKADHPLNVTSWTFAGQPIECCLSQVIPPQCALRVSIQILIAVMVMDLVKLIIMITMLSKVNVKTLVVVGDALASFLNEPDVLTTGRCLLSKKEATKKTFPSALAQQPIEVPFKTTRPRRWSTAVGRFDYAFLMTFGFTLLLLAAGFLGYGYVEVQDFGGVKDPLNGFGRIDSASLIHTALPSTGAGGLVAPVIVANMPQLIISLLYVAYNNIMTIMLQAHEYSQYGVAGERAPLRVSKPRGEQISKPRLHLPLSYSIPMAIVATTLHWLISQSIFVVGIDYNHNGSDRLTPNMTVLGYSLLPLLLVLILGLGILIVPIVLGFRRFSSTIPVAGSCSLALAAACHRPENDVDAAYQQVAWGEVKAEGGVGHCCFTSQEVTLPIEGRLYA